MHLAGDRDRFGLQEQQQVVGPAGLGIGPAHVEAAERVDADQRPGALAVHVEVADEELVLGPGDPLRIARCRPRRSARTRYRWRWPAPASKSPARMTARTGPKISSWAIRARGVDVGEDRRLDEIAIARRPLAASEQPAFAAADLDVVEDPFQRPLVDHRADVDRRDRPGRRSAAGASAATSASRNRSYTARSTIAREHAEHFCPAKPKAEATTPVDRRLQIGVVGHDDRVLAAHLGDHALDPALAGRPSAPRPR